MARKPEPFLIRRVADGTIRVVQANTARGAMAKFMMQYAPPVGEYFQMKQRGSGDWENYKVNAH